MIKVIGKSENIMNQALQQAISHWQYVAPIVTRPQNKKQLEKLQSILDELLDTIGDNESHKLMGLVDLVSMLIASYEAEFTQLSKPSGIDALKYLMEVNELSQGDLPEVGSQGVVSEVLSGKRQLNLRQVKALARRFKVASTTFIDD